MKIVQKLTLDHNDIKEAIKYWIENYHGLTYDDDAGDRILVRGWPPIITVTLKDDLT